MKIIGLAKGCVNVSMGDIRVVICDDCPLFRELLTEYLLNEKEIHITDAVGSRDELMSTLVSSETDLLLLDINLNPNDNFNRSGIEIAMEVKQQYPGMKIIILSSIDETEIVTHAMTFGGADNYVLKSCYQDIAQAIQDVYRNRNHIHYSTAGKLIEALTSKTEKELHEKINSKQKEILRLFDEGFDRKEIAKKLFTCEQVISNEIFKISKILKGKTPYFEMLRIKKVNVKELVEVAKKLKILQCKHSVGRDNSLNA